jgi:hypothetical protein
MSLQMAVPTAPETERIFGALSEGGTIRMAGGDVLGHTFRRDDGPFRH